METVFLSIAALACPVGMGLMMWFMGRGMRDKPEEHRALGSQRRRDRS